MSGAAPAVVAIFGPTGSGKTEVAVRVARELGTEVVNCDPAQCYRGLPILTNQPGPEHDAVAPHRLVGVHDLRHEASFVEFAGLAHATIDELVAERGHAVLAGGSGLYLQAALTALALEDAGSAALRDPAVRERWERRYDAEGGGSLHAVLAERDPAAAERVHPNDRTRVVRALELAELGGSAAPGGQGSHWDAPHRHPTRLVGLQVPRPALRERIDERTRGMFAAGLLDEVAAVVGPRAERADEALSHTARKLHGLRECIAILDGSLPEDEGRERMAAQTRQYAKRQDTWARRWPGLETIPTGPGRIDEVAAAVSPG